MRADVIEEAVSAIKAYVAEADNDPCEDIRIDKIELRLPTRSKSDILREWGKEPPELMWFADITRFPRWPHGGYAGMIWLDAYTGEVVLGSLED